MEKTIRSLFASQKDWWHNACLNWARDPLELYVVGYREAAELLVDDALNHRKPIDSLVYPIIFLYRHYFELRLKELIRESRALLRETAEFPKRHEIDELWKEARALLAKVFENESESPDFSEIDEVLMELAHIDPMSFAFRYPRDKKGGNPLDGITHINIRHFAERVDSVAGLLDGASIGVSHYRELQGEIDSHYGSPI